MPIHNNTILYIIPLYIKSIPCNWEIVNTIQRCHISPIDNKM